MVTASATTVVASGARGRQWPATQLGAAPKGPVVPCESAARRSADLGAEWAAELGADAEDTHDDYLHTLGNLTLTGYNSELGNLPFSTKQERYAASHVELNS